MTCGHSAHHFLKNLHIDEAGKIEIERFHFYWKFHKYKSRKVVMAHPSPGAEIALLLIFLIGKDNSSGRNDHVSRAITRRSIVMRGTCRDEGMILSISITTFEMTSPTKSIKSTHRLPSRVYTSSPFSCYEPGEYR